ncbi:hypothetical protein TUBRATIS_004830 [Tubulinosema ratisbonensis]|uniref:Uncharacterized protein n=1 Tax=Tubulinosema ratisbonensis TaxID=291195 RepID=A0A437APB5_9MICR|nr:hypothetical protein TUBRATIS_004830 [Tubulinosema ratisbonensis]
MIISFLLINILYGSKKRNTQETALETEQDLSICEKRPRISLEFDQDVGRIFEETKEFDFLTYNFINDIPAKESVKNDLDDLNDLNFSDMMVFDPTIEKTTEIHTQNPFVLYDYNNLKSSEEENEIAFTTEIDELFEDIDSVIQDNILSKNDDLKENKWFENPCAGTIPGSSYGEDVYIETGYNVDVDCEEEIDINGRNSSIDMVEYNNCTGILSEIPEEATETQNTVTQQNTSRMIDQKTEIKEPIILFNLLKTSGHQNLKQVYELSEKSLKTTKIILLEGKIPLPTKNITKKITPKGIKRARRSILSPSFKGGNISISEMYADVFYNLKLYSANTSKNFTFKVPGLKHPLEVAKPVIKLEQETVLRFSNVVRVVTNVTFNVCNIIDLYSFNKEIKNKVDNFLLNYVYDQEFSSEKLLITKNSEDKIAQTLLDRFMEVKKIFLQKYKHQFYVTRIRCRGSGQISRTLPNEENLKIYQYSLETIFRKKEYSFLIKLFPEIKFILLDSLNHYKNRVNGQRVFLLVGLIIVKYRLLQKNLYLDLTNYSRSPNFSYTDSPLLCQFIFSIKMLIFRFFFIHMLNKIDFHRFKSLFINTFLSFIRIAHPDCLKQMEFDEFFFVNYFIHDSFLAGIRYFMHDEFDDDCKTNQEFRFSFSELMSEYFTEKIKELMIFVIRQNINKCCEEDNELSQIFYKTDAEILDIFVKKKRIFTDQLMNFLQED